MRRLDWRFLLPVAESGSYANAVLIGADETLLGVARWIGLAAQAQPDLPSEPGSVDLVGVLNGQRVDFAAIAGALRPGGVVYWEVDRRRTWRVTPKRIDAALRSAGLEPIAAYGVRPHLAGAELYVPLDSLAAARWFVRSVYIPGRLVQAVAEWASRVLLHSRRAFAAALPFHVVIAQKAPVGGTRLAEVLVPAEPNTAAPAMLSHGGTRAVFVFCDQGGQPTLVAKVPKLRSLVHRTEREQEVLAHLHASVPSKLGVAAPVPRGVVEVHGRFVALETGQPGASMARRSSRWGTTMTRRIDDLSSAANWIARLHVDHPLGSRQWGAEVVDDVLGRPIRDYAKYFGLTAQDEALFDRVQALAGTFVGPLPVVWEHGDYTVWNVFRREPRDRTAADDHLAVLDWEGARAGLPYVDIFRFAVHWTELASRRHGRLERQALLQRSLFGDSTAAGRAVRAALDEYLKVLSLDPLLEPVLVTRLYVDLAVRRHEILLDSGAAPADPRATNPAQHMVEHLAALGDRLVPGHL